MDLNYKGAYNAGTNYTVGDVVKFTDDVWYVRRPADSGKAGYPCNDSKRWGRADAIVATAAEMAMEAAKAEPYKIYKLNGAVSDSGDEEDVLIATGATETFEVAMANRPDVFLGARITTSSGLSDNATGMAIVGIYPTAGSQGAMVSLLNQSDSDITLIDRDYAIGLEVYGLFV